MTRPILLVAFALSPISAVGQGFTPAEAVKRMKLPDGFSVRVVAAEPMIRQPVSMSFDERGRLWVLQYLQYPNPAGMKPVTQDQYLRTIWDKFPEPPPRGPKGADRLTICYDPDENGVFLKSKDFVGGLNIASGFCLGNGGVYIIQPPYLLFYPDKNRDDIPDGDPEVLLTGFGMDDTHSLANSLQWGPDGWLYGAAGSTSTCKIRNPAGKPTDPLIEFQQGIWRYHPATKRFELFSEGGGNTYGLDFDRHGQAIAGTNWGGFAMLHQVQGAYYVKGFAKHGPLHNPHAYGYFDHVPYTNFKGGHVTCGGIVYQADAYPPAFRDQYIAANLLSNAVYWHKLEPLGSSFKASHGGDLLVANDTWFRPVDLIQGPDGCVYVADFYDVRAAHLDPIDNWDRSNGRIYRIEYKGPPKLQTFDLNVKSSVELVELLKHPNVWWRRESRRILGERKEPGVYDTLREVIHDERGDLALEALWALYVSGGWSERTGWRGDHPNPHVRAWLARFLGDTGVIERADTRYWLLGCAYERDPIILSQVACTARRLPAEEARSIYEKLIDNEHAAADPHLPQLVWWAIESKIVVNHGSGLQQPQRLAYSKMGPFLAERFARRAADDTSGLNREVLLFLKNEVSSYTLVRATLTGIDAVGQYGYGGDFAEKIRDALAQLMKHHPKDDLLLRVSAKLGVRDGVERVRELADDAKLPPAQRGKWLAMSVRMKQVSSWENGLALLPQVPPGPVQTDLLAALAGVESENPAQHFLAEYPKWPAKLKQAAISHLLTRSSWAAELLREYDAGKIPKADLTLDHARTAVGLNDPTVTKLVEKHFGKLAPATPGEKQARISWLDVALSRTKGDPLAGKPIFTKTCATCHKLHGEGNAIGPDLTTADRKNRRLLLTNIVDPSLSVRPEFIAHSVSLADGRKLVGLVAVADANAITLLDAENRKTIIPRADIESLNPSSVSLMPEKSLDALTDQQVADLFAYLQSDPPKR